MLQKPPSGFTLIELSIVLVIIGLIIGGVLVGRNLIEIAQARKMMSQMEKIQAAVTTFRVKYNCKTGDCNKATQFGLGTNGNGDGMNGGRNATSWPIGLYGQPIDGGANTALTDIKSNHNIFYTGRGFGEFQLFFTHLSAAGLIDQNIVSAPISDTGLDTIMDTLYPKDALDKKYMHATTLTNKVYIRTGLDSVTPSFGSTRYSTSATFSATQMNYIASKFSYPVLVSAATTEFPAALEQGQRVVPVSGYQYFYWSPQNAGTASPACAVTDGAGGYKYNLANNGRCDFLWQIDY